ncbi:MAG: hypothetical protein NTY19_27505 [Planctomycetota bacterium]|nr:hypothetical protein [Planctomycetota bacterium]
MASFELAQRGGMGGGGLREGVVVRQDPVGGTQVLVRDRVVVKLWVRLESGQGGMGGGGFH